MKKIKEGVRSHTESILNLAEQMKKYILKHKENPNSTVNDVAIALFMSFSEAFSQDGDESTTGLGMLQKIVDKVKNLMKDYEDLVPEEEEEFDLEDGDVKDMELTLGSDKEVIEDEEEEESDGEDVLEDETDGEEDELDNLTAGLDDEEDDSEDEEENEDVV